MQIRFLNTVVVKKIDQCLIGFPFSKAMINWVDIVIWDCYQPKPLCYKQKIGTTVLLALGSRFGFSSDSKSLTDGYKQEFRRANKMPKLTT